MTSRAPIEDRRHAPPLSFSTKLCFGIGQAAEGVKNTAFNVFLFFYFNQVLGLSGWLAGLALLLATVLDAVSDPLAGSISDAFHHRWGRRHPFMYASAVPLAVSFYLLFSPPAGLGELGLFAWLTAFAILTRQAMTLYHVPHLALGAELSADYQERTNVVAYRTVFGIFGGLLVVALGWSIFFRGTPEFPNGQLDAGAYTGFGFLFAAVMLATIWASALGTHSRIPYLPRPTTRLSGAILSGALGDVREALGNRSFRYLALGVVVFFVTRGVQEALGLHVATYFWELSPGAIQTLQLTVVGGFIAGVPVWTVASRRLDKKPTLLIGIVWFSIFNLLPPLARITGWLPGPGSDHLDFLVVMAAMSAFGGAGGLVAAGSMMADVADEHELKTGRRQEGIFFGALSLAGKSASGLGHGVAGLGVDVIGFPAQAAVGTIPEATLIALGILYGPGVAVLAAIGIALLFGYRLTRARHAEILAELAARRLAAGDATA